MNNGNWRSGINCLRQRDCWNKLWGAGIRGNIEMDDEEQNKFYETVLTVSMRISRRNAMQRCFTFYNNDA